MVCASRDWKRSPWTVMVSLGEGSQSDRNPRCALCQPPGTAGSADPLDPVDVLERHVLLIPVDAGGERRIDASPVDHHQHLVSVLIGEAANTDGPGVRIHLSDVYPWHHPQQIWNIGGARLADIFQIDDVYGRSGLGRLLFSLGNGGDLDIHEIFQAVLSEVVGRRDL